MVGGWIQSISRVVSGLVSVINLPQAASMVEITVGAGRHDVHVVSLNCLILECQNQQLETGAVYSSVQRIAILH